MNNPFKTSRTFDRVGKGLASDLMDLIHEDADWQKFLEDVLTGEREPRELPAEFQRFAEYYYEQLTNNEDEAARITIEDALIAEARNWKVSG